MPMIVAGLLVVVAMRVGLRREATLTAMAVVALAGGIWFNHAYGRAAFRVYWHSPSLKVDSQQYHDALALAAMTDPHCAILAPETVSQWVSTIEGAPYPVFARRLYLIHYRFSMPEAERAARVHLADLVETGAVAELIDLHQLKIPIGTLAVMRDAGPHPAATQLARELGLPGPIEVNDMVVWKGGCGTERN
jgi:hypothetical protein